MANFASSESYAQYGLGYYPVADTSLSGGLGWTSSFNYWTISGSFISFATSESYKEYSTGSYAHGDTSLSGGIGWNANWLLVDSFLRTVASESFNEYSTGTYPTGSSALSGGYGWVVGSHWEIVFTSSVFITNQRINNGIQSNRNYRRYKIANYNVIGDIHALSRGSKRYHKTI